MSGTDPRLPRPLRGFRHVFRYWDTRSDKPGAKIKPGEYYVTLNDEAVVTVLGSCIAACVRDPEAAVGGMNHFLLPRDRSGLDIHVGDATRYGNFAMEHLINEILKHGGDKERLEVKLFGGGRILDIESDVGQMNIDFVHDYVHTEQLRLLSEDVGDITPRRVVYHPRTGEAFVKKLFNRHHDIVEEELRYRKSLEVEPVAGPVELF